uniref:G_PROTEIN_RECEP_F1_2 domain-containing protein n=1 Tax=Syphacia muris TaxID=451379 RepID=A0A0N5AFI3_9BILA
MSAANSSDLIMAFNSFNDTLVCLRRMESDPSHHTLVGVFYTVLTTIAVILDLLLLIIYYKLWYKIGNAVIYRMSLSLAVSSIVEISVNFYYMIPCTFTSCTFYYHSDVLLIVLAVPETVGFYTSSFTNSMIAVERLALFFSKPVNLFIGKYHKILIAIPWIFGVTVAAVAALIGCHKRFVDQFSLCLIWLVLF